MPQLPQMAAAEIGTDVSRPAQTLRTDAARNRRRILRAARELFRTGGLNVAMTVVASRSGVGAATLYRRFPTRDALIDELVRDAADRSARVFADAAVAADAWSGLSVALRRLTALQVEVRGCTAGFAAAFPEHVIEHSRLVDESLAALLERARAAGAVRADVAVSDLRLLLDAVGPTAEPLEDERRAQARAQRVVTHFLRSFHVQEEQ